MSKARGFTLLEVVVALAIAGLLTAMLAQVMGQALANSRILDASLSSKRELTALRRLLHRDLRSASYGADMLFTSDSLSFETSHSMLGSGHVPVTVTWRLWKDDSMAGRREGLVLVREERQADLGYVRRLELLTLDGASSAQLFDASRKTWVDLATWALPGTSREQPKALRLTLTVQGEKTEILERFTHVRPKNAR